MTTRYDRPFATSPRGFLGLRLALSGLGIALLALWSSGNLMAGEAIASSSLIWNPAKEQSLTLGAEGVHQRMIDKAGVVEFLVRTGDDQDIDLKVRRADREDAGQRVHVRAGGWQRLALPLAAFGLKSPHYPGFVLTAPANTATITLASRDDSAWPTGPGMSDRQLLDLIDLDRPELATVRAASMAGDQAGALRLLAHHFRTRSTVSWTLPPAPVAGAEATAAIEAADKVVRGEFTMLINTVQYPGGVIDWNLDPTVGSPNQTNEWIWSIGRHEFTSKLLAGWQANGNPAYGAFWLRSLHSWTQAMPVPAVDWQTPGSGWRYIEAGLRMGEFWPHAWFGLTANTHATDADILTMVKSVWEHGEFLARKTTGVNNHFVIGLTGQYMAGSLFPEFKISATWRQDAARLLQEFVVSRCDTDAGWYERSSSYHDWLVEKIDLVFNTARINHYEHDFTPAFRNHMRRMAEWGVRLSTPARIIPAQNDSTNDPLSRVCAPKIRKELPASPVLDWAWAASQASDIGQAPLPASELLADSGYAVMRTSWGSQASYVLFDVGPMGGGHGHLDALNLIYAPDGVMTVFDGTGGTYNASDFRPWSRSTASHNAVLVDKLNQFRPGESAEDPVGKLPPETPTPVFTTWEGGAYTCGWHVGGFGKKGQVQVRHRREILFATASGVVVVVDTLTPTDEQEHRYDLRWHLRTTTWRMDESKRIMIPTKGDQTLMAVVPLAAENEVHADSGVMKPEILGWDVLKSNPSTDPVPALTVRHLRKAIGPTTFVTALIPGSVVGSATPVIVGESDGWVLGFGGIHGPITVRVGSTTLQLKDGTTDISTLRTTIP